MSCAGGPDLITNGLVFHIDPSNPKCYTSGSTCKDLTNINGNGTLTNVSLSSDKAFQMSIYNSSRVYFNRSYTNISDKHTIIVSAFCPNLTQGNFGSLIASMDINFAGWIIGFYDPNGANPYIQFYGAEDSGNLYFDLQYSITPKANFINRFYVIAGVINNNLVQLYVNGILRSSQSLASSLGVNTKNLIELGYNSDGDNWTQNGIKIYSASVYNRPLNSVEILQNYNALKGRFRLT
ncbi:MAG: hypothetical protein EBR82_44410 [Caulobacteraceae bacterium]|nr:hypothetical protein [Caulobacteraceae bacterium]NDG33521.1 hypothetical protein [bacterium]